MNYQDIYKYSWFANLAYIEWGSLGTSTPDSTAGDEEVLPGEERGTDPN